MPATTLRATYTISSPVLQRFNAVVPHGQRSRVMEDLMKQALAQRESELDQLVDTYMTDSAFATCREDEKLWDFNFTAAPTTQSPPQLAQTPAHETAAALRPKSAVTAARQTGV